MASSRFFAGSDDSDTDSSSSEDEVVGIQKQQAPTTRQIFYDSDSDDDTKRVVRSEKEKRFEELSTLIKTSKNLRKINDMSNVLTTFESLTKAFEKAKRVIEKEGLPHFFIKHLCELEDYVNQHWENREGRKAMSKNNATGLSKLRQRMKKYVKTEDFDEQMAKCRANPDEYLAEDEEEVVEEPEVAAEIIPEKKEKRVKIKEPAAEDSDDSIDWASSSDESSSDDEEYQDNPALRFLKKASTEDKVKKEKVKREQKEQKKKHESDEEGAWTEVAGTGARIQEGPKINFGKEDVTHEAVLKKLLEVIAVRGKKSTSKTDQHDLLKELRDIAVENKLGPAIECKIHFNIVAAVFDYNPTVASCMRPETWDRCLTSIEQLLNLLAKNPDIKVSLNTQEDQETVSESPYRLRGCIYSTVERMDDEFVRMLQSCDAHSPEYVDRLKDERRVCKIIESLREYGSVHASTDEMCRTNLLAIKHIYYKYDKAADEGSSESSLNEMSSLCRYIYSKDDTDRIRTQAILYHIYHQALHNRWFDARDLMLMSHLQDSVIKSDVPTQICYNRCMVQLGLCAFRKGYIRDAHNCLADIQSSLKVRELLAQGLLMRGQNDRTAAQEKIEKRRQMPYHMHINLELLECAYLISAMLIEIPYLAAHELDTRRAKISKNFHHVLKTSEKNPLVGPPESMREHIVQASKAMKRGEWKACVDYLINDKMNMKVWDLFNNKQDVKDMIISKVQEETLRTYMFTFSSIYDSLSMTILADMFDLPLTTVHSIISKMIINEELMASLDEPTQSVMMHRTEPSRLQSIALQLSEKVSQLVENNERLMEVKQPNMNKGGGNYDKNRQDGGYRQQRNQGGWNRQKNYRQKNY